MRYLPLLAAALFSFSSIYGASVEDKPASPPLDVKKMRFVDALEHDAGVYVCTVTKVEQIGGQDPVANIQQGSVTLAVSETLRGASRSTIALPYYAVGAGSFYYVWQFPPKVGPERLIFVVVPNTFESGTPKYPDIHEAIEGFEEAGENDASLHDIKAFLKLYDTKSPPGGPLDGKNLARAFSMLMEPLNFEAVYPVSMTKFIEQFTKVTDSKVITAGFDLLGSILSNPIYDKTVSINKPVSFWFCEILAKLAENQVPETRHRALRELSVASSTLARRFHASLSKCLSTEEQAALSAVLDAEAHSTDPKVLNDIDSIHTGLGK